jgi:Protein of unknown function (DUF2909)
MHTPLLIKVFIVVALAAIIVSLGVALLRLRRERGLSTGTVKALTVRIVLSIALFLLLVLGFFSGVIVPHGVVP